MSCSACSISASSDAVIRRARSAMDAAHIDDVAAAEPRPKTLLGSAIIPEYDLRVLSE